MRVPAPTGARTSRRGAEAEQARLERAERERAQREAQSTGSGRRSLATRPLSPLSRASTRSSDADRGDRAPARSSFDAELARDREAGKSVAAELRACAQEEAGIQSRLHAAGEALTTAEVRSQRSRDQEADAEQALRALAAELQLEPTAADEPLPDERREELRTRLERLASAASSLAR